jgi:hypothetical protein
MTTTDRFIGLIVRLHPPAYRAEHHAEIASTARDSLAAQGRLGAVRELADLAAHALRQRTGLAATSAPGAVAAAAAPLTVASAIAVSGVFLAFAEWDWWDGIYPPEIGPRVGPFTTLGPVAYIAWLLVLVAVIFGRGGAARSLTRLATAVSIAIVPLAWSTALERPPLFVLSALVLLGTVALAAPVDPLGRSPLDRRVVIVGTLAIAGFLSAISFGYGTLDRPRPLGYRVGSIHAIGYWTAVALVTLLVVSLLCLRLDRRLPLVAAVVAYPWAVLAYGAYLTSPAPAPVPLTAAAMCVAGLIGLVLVMATVNAVYRMGRHDALRVSEKN